MFNDYIPYQTREQVNAAKELMSNNQNEEALNLLLTSLEIYDSHIANRLIGDIYIKQRNLDAALLYYLKVYEQFKFHDQFLNNMALIYLNKNDMTNAKKCYDQMKLVEPRSGYLRNLSLLLSSTN